MSFNVQLPDGTVINDIPDGTSKEEFDQKYKQHQMTHAAAPPSLEDRAMDFGGRALKNVAAIGTGIARGAADIVGIPGEIQDWSKSLPPSKTFGKFEPPIDLPKGPDIQRAVGNATGMDLYQPQTLGEKYLEQAGHGAVGMINPFGKTRAVEPLFGALSQMGGFAADKMEPGNVAAKAAGEGGPLAALMYFMMKKPQDAKALTGWLKATGEDKLRAAGGEAQKASDVLGTAVSPAQGGDIGLFDNLAALAARHPAGTKLQDMFGKQTAVGEGKFQELADALSQRGFGQAEANKIVNSGSFPALWGGPTAATDQMFTKAMQKSGTATFDQLTGKLNAMSADDVREVAGNMTKADPGAFPNLVKKTFADAFQAGKKSDNSLASIPAQIRGPKGTQQSARFDAMVEEAAKANGQDPTVARLAANELLDSMETASRLRGPTQATGDITEKASRTLAGSLFESAGVLMPFRNFGRSLDRAAYEKVADKVIESLTTPDGIDQLIKLSRFSNFGHKTKAVARGFFSAAQQNQ